MTKRDEFTESELEKSRVENIARLERVAAYKRKWHQDNKERTSDAKKAKADYMRKWRKENIDLARAISRGASAKYSAANPATRRKSSRDYNARRRAELISFFGDKCIRCGFDDFRALHLDHINGGGNKERLQGKHGLYDKWKMTRDAPDLAKETFQLLCANCNNIKRFEDYEYSDRARLRKAAGL